MRAYVVPQQKARIRDLVSTETLSIHSLSTIYGRTLLLTEEEYAEYRLRCTECVCRRKFWLPRCVMGWLIQNACASYVLDRTLYEDIVRYVGEAMPSYVPPKKEK